MFSKLSTTFAALLAISSAPLLPVTAVSLPRDTVEIAAKPPNAASLRACAIKVLGADALSRLVSRRNSTYDDARLGEKIQYVASKMRGQLGLIHLLDTSNFRP